MTEVVIAAGVRTPFTGRSRALGEVDEAQLAAAAVNGAACRAGRTPEAVILGSCIGPGGNVGRRAALAAGLGTQTPGWSVDAQCGSGMVAVQQGIAHVAATGSAVCAGGVESPSTAPTRSLHGVPYARAPFTPEGHPDPDMLEAADELARRRGISRQRQEHYALRSHELARHQVDLLAAERVSVPRTTGPTSAEQPDPVRDDDGPRPMAPQLLARFPTLRESPDLPRTGSPHNGATVTAATTARIADGAAALLLMPGSPHSGETAPPPAGPQWTVRSAVTVGGDPALPGEIPAAAIRRACQQAGLGVDDLAAVELVEAFSAQVLACLDDLGLAGGDEVDPRVNAAGGALALGHPWGASGAAVVVRLIHRLAAAPLGARGVASCAIGGGMASALVLERTA